jgi:hypothetical protein
MKFLLFSGGSSPCLENLSTVKFCEHLTVVMESIKNHVKYDPKYKILICCHHNYAIKPGIAIKRHFQDFHRNMSTGTRQKILAAVKDLELAEGEDIEVQYEGEPIEGIEVKRDGCRCLYQDCEGYYTAEVGAMREHCKKKHRWQSKDDIMWETQAVQTIFSGITLGFRVDSRPTPSLLSCHRSQSRNP